MCRAVLITGGAGFIGSHLADTLLQRGDHVRVLDNLEPPVHGDDHRRPGYLDADVELITGDIRDPEAVARALDGIDSVVHLAACVGVGQSMYEVARYTDVNNRGTAVLLEGIIKNPIERLVVASVYGTRQALSNPYTGVLAIFASRLLNDKRPLVNEDGLQRRDFVSVQDVAQAIALALDKAGDVAGQVFNVGGGRNYTVAEIARKLAEVLGKPHIEPEITGKYRVGDIRHCFADISLTRDLLGYEPKVDFEEGLLRLAQWLAGQIAVDRVPQAAAELSARGLTV